MSTSNDQSNTPSPAPSPNEIAALRLIASGGRGMTERANVIVSAVVANLLRLGLIEYASTRRVGYKLTNEGRRAIA